MSEIALSTEKFFSLINGEAVRKAYEKIPAAERQLNETEVVACLKPTKTDWKLRIRFWDLIGKATDPKNEYDKVYTIDIIEDICQDQVFYKKLKRKYFASFLFSPIESYTDEVDTMLAITRDKMWRLINYLEPVKKDGTVDRTHANLLIKVHSQLVERKMGAVKQLIEMKKVQLNVNTDVEFSDDIELLDNQIRELKPSVTLIEKSGLSKVEEGTE